MTLTVLLATLLVRQAVSTSIVRHGDSWELLRDGKPYTIKGGGGNSHLDQLVAAGGNSFRTWGAETLDQDLTEAEKRGLTVCAGIWLGHKPDVDYSDPAQVGALMRQVREVVNKYKDRPGLLMWGIGNEMENGNDTPEVWKAVDLMAQLAKKLDPNHPVMSVVAEVGPEKIANIQKYAPNLDLLGVNSYGGLLSLPDRLKRFGWTKPYVVTEFGPVGHWEMPKTSWGAPIEQNSTEKAEFYQKGYDHSIGGQAGWCLGSYAFLWGHKQEATPTWFGMFLPDGKSVGSVDVMQHEWTGKWPDTLAPKIEKLSFGDGERQVSAGSSLSAEVRMVSDVSGLSYHWTVLPEVLERKADGNGEVSPDGVEVGLGSTRTGQATFTAPSKPGAYRLYVVVSNGAGKAATANVPFLVK